MEKTLNSKRYEFVCQMLRDARLAVGLTQIDLAAKLQIHQTEVSRVERGIRRLDLLETHDWLNALDIPLLEFLVALDGGLFAMRLRNRTDGPDQLASSAREPRRKEI